MMDSVRALDATDATQIIQAVQEWINGLKILDNHLWLEYTEDPNGFGYCIKADGGAVTDEDIVGNFSACVPFFVYYKTNAIPDAAGTIYKPLNDLSAWFRANGTAGLDIGKRRKPDEITTLSTPKDLSGQDEDGNTTFFAVFQITYDEEAIL